MGYSRAERLALCATLEKAGPDAPTLCAGWASRDLAAHLVLRERRPDAAAGIPGGPLAGHTAKVQQRLAATPYPALLATIRSGPPRLSPFAIPALDERANTVEFFVHNEDVRRAAPDWAPREISPGLSDTLWDRLRMARFTLRKAPVGVEFARNDDGAGPDGQEGGAGGNGTGEAPEFRMTVRRSTPVVTVIGKPAELILWASGRTSVAQVRLDGAKAAIAMLSQASWRLLRGAHVPLHPGQLVLHARVARRRDVLDGPLRCGHDLAPWLALGDLALALRLFFPDLSPALPGEAVLAARLDRHRDDHANDEGDNGPLEQAEHRFENDEGDQGADCDHEDLGPAHQPPPFRGYARPEGACTTP
jgi:uncharacterized protein (TIGR03085 family)